MRKGATVSRIFDRILDVMAIIAGVMSAFIMVLLCYMVIMRYLFSKPPAWVIEICEYLLIYITFLSTTWLLRKNGHVRVDLFLIFFSSTKKKIVQILTSVVGSLACAVLIWYSFAVTLDNYERHILSIHTLSVPKWMLYAIIPIGAFFLAIEFSRQAVNALQKVRRQLFSTRRSEADQKQGG